MSNNADASRIIPDRVFDTAKQISVNMNLLYDSQNALQERVTSLERHLDRLDKALTLALSKQQLPLDL